MRLRIVGTRHVGTSALKALAELSPGAELLLKRESTNRHDRFAIEVWANETKIGYVAAEDNRDLANDLDRRNEPNAKANFVRGKQGGAYAVIE